MVPPTDSDVLAAAPDVTSTWFAIDGPRENHARTVCAPSLTVPWPLTRDALWEALHAIRDIGGVVQKHRRQSGAAERQVLR